MDEWTWIVRRNQGGEEAAIIEELLATPDLADAYIADAEAQGDKVRRVKVEAGHDWAGHKLEDPFFAREVSRIIVASRRQEK